MIKLVKSFVKSIMKVKIIKALIGVVVVLLGYKYVRYFLKFNKFIIYLLGLLFVSLNLNDYYIIQEIKLTYDVFKVWIFSFLPDNEINKEIINNTKDDMKEILYSDHIRKPSDIDRDYILIDKSDVKKSMRNEIKESAIIVDNEIYTWCEILTDPIVLFILIGAIIGTGKFILL